MSKRTPTLLRSEWHSIKSEMIKIMLNEQKKHQFGTHLENLFLTISIGYQVTQSYAFDRFSDLCGCLTIGPILSRVGKAGLWNQ